MSARKGRQEAWAEDRSCSSIQTVDAQATAEEVLARS